MTREQFQQQRVIENFILRRFPSDVDKDWWLVENDYFFAVILADVFAGDVVYHTYYNHFFFRSLDMLYDINGYNNIASDMKDKIYNWDNYWFQQPQEYKRIANKNCF